MKAKKVLIAMLLLCLLLCSVMLLASCGHEHELSEVAAVKATCAKGGTESYYTCSGCDKLFEDAEGSVEIETPKATEKLAHTEVVVDGKVATCTEKGLTQGKKCSVCDEVLVAQEEISVMGHSFVNYVSDNNATCTEDGTKTAKCDNCDETDTIADEDTAKGHDYKSVVTPPTCDARGYTTYICQNNSEHTYVDDYVDASGHSYGSWSVTTDPTVDAVGTISRTCPVCDDVDTADLPKLNVTDYTVNTSLTDSVLTTVFVYNGGEVEYSVSLTSSGYVSVNGQLYSRYDVAKLNNEGVTVSFDEASGFTYHAATAQTLTQISTNGCGLTLTGTLVINSGASITFTGGDLNIGTESVAADVTINSSVTEAILIGSGNHKINVNKGSSLAINLDDATWTAVRFNHRNTCVLNVYGTFTTNGGLSSNRYHKYVIYEGASVTCGFILTGDGNAVTVDGTLTVNGNMSAEGTINVGAAGILVVYGSTSVDPIVAEGGRAFIGGTYRYTVNTYPTYTNAGSLTRTCMLTGEVVTIDIPAISAENGYIKRFGGFASRWEYTYDNFTFNVDIEETVASSDSYAFTANDAYNIAAGSNTAAYHNSGYFSAVSGNTFTTTLTVSGDAAVRFIIKGAATEGTCFVSELISSVKVNHKDGCCILSTEQVQFTGSADWKSFYVATLFLDKGVNTITFSVARDINMAGISFDSLEEISIVPKSDKVDINLLTFNIRTDVDSGIKAWDSRKEALLQMVIDANPSVALFQEVKSTQIDDLEAILGAAAYTVIYNGSGLAIAYKTDEWEKISESNFWLSDTPDVPSYGWGAEYPRQCLNILLRHKLTGQYLNVFNVHLDFNTLAKVNSMKLIMERAAAASEAAGIDYPIFIAGDFNDGLGAEAYTETSKQYRDPRYYSAITDFGTTCSQWGAAIDTDHRGIIDHIFVSKDHFICNELQAIRTRLENNFYPSDHFAVMAKVSLICPHTHIEAIDEAVEADCTSTGLTEGSHCLICNKILVAQTTVNALGHSYESDADTSCGKCGFVRNLSCSHENTVAIGEAKDATCTELGQTAGEKCADCGEVLVAQIISPKLAHTVVVDKAVAADCINSGLTEGVHCSVCDTVLVAQTVIPGGHTETTVFENVVEPDFTHGGSFDHVVFCSVCNTEFSRKTVDLPILNVTDYTTETSFTNSVLTTVFTYNSDGIEYSVSLTSSGYISVNGQLYSRYDVAKLNNEGVTVSFDEASGFTYHAATAQTLTQISTNGCGLTLTGTLVINSGAPITFTGGDLNIGTESVAADVTINSSVTEAILIGSGNYNVNVNKGSSLAINLDDATWTAVRFSHRQTCVLNVYGTLTTNGGLSGNRYHTFAAREGGSINCGHINNGMYHTLTVDGVMTVYGNVAQTSGSSINVAATGILVIVGTSNVEPTVTEGGKVTVKNLPCGNVICHSNIVWSVTTEPTVDAVGSISQICSACSTVLDTVELPKLNPTDYTATTSLVNNVLTTVFVYNGDEVEYSVSLTSSGYISVNGQLYSRYDVAKLNNEGVTVSFDEASGFTYHAATAQTLTQISTNGCGLTLTGTLVINSGASITFTGGDLNIGTESVAADVTINSSVKEAILISSGNYKVNVNKGSSLAINLDDATWTAVRFSHRNSCVLNVYGILTTNGGLSGNRYHTFAAREGGNITCGFINNGSSNTLTIDGVMTVNGNVTQSSGAINVGATGTLTVTGTSNIAPTITEGGKATVNGQEIS